ncbi:uroporphyrinogen-III synthase [Litorimonas sp. WD9-15]|uniref:uroporphyrinogen-III synthase n=1 Tax=Litorimonas sp. WD9-15 TaxID=3418716 RepID=UPI003D031536
MTKTIWITRTQPAAAQSASVWAEAGFEPEVLALLDVMPVAYSPIPKNAILIFTAKNGVDHMAQTDHRAICVGDATAAHAEASGFRDVVSVDGTSADITRWVLANLNKDGTLIHISGRHVRGTITEDLAAAGYNATRVITYELTPVPTWPVKRISHVALYSPLAAKTFAELARERDVSTLTTVSISKATNAELDGLSLNARYIATRPTEAALVKAVQTP